MKLNNQSPVKYRELATALVCESQEWVLDQPIIYWLFIHFFSESLFIQNWNSYGVLAVITLVC
ncbi:hypothetical protein [Mesobacillus foraminis]|uniref:hypothetical protein n=1 Tax=Mesobacillus foraminis TaxID=279826 RepID=UPI0035D10EA2